MYVINLIEHFIGLVINAFGNKRHEMEQFVTASLDQYQVNLPDPATPIMFGIHSLHNHILFFMCVIFIVVVTLLFSIVYYFSFYPDEYYLIGFYVAKVYNFVICRILSCLLFVILSIFGGIDIMFRLFTQHNFVTIYLETTANIWVRFLDAVSLFIILVSLGIARIFSTIRRVFNHFKFRVAIFRGLLNEGGQPSLAVLAAQEPQFSYVYPLV